MSSHTIYGKNQRICKTYRISFPGDVSGKEPPVSAGNIRDTGSIPGLGRSPGEGDGNTLQYSCLEDPMDRGAWQATIHSVTELDTIEAT